MVNFIELLKTFLDARDEVKRFKDLGYKNGNPILQEASDAMQGAEWNLNEFMQGRLG